VGLVRTPWKWMFARSGTGLVGSNAVGLFCISSPGTRRSRISRRMVSPGSATSERPGNIPS
jgi:hypothetical protein